MNIALHPNSVPQLMDSLRHELHQYGEMLALLEQQQESVFSRAADNVLQSAASVHDQMLVISAARQQRQGCQNQIAEALEQTQDAPFDLLIPLLPAKFQLAVGALVREINETLVRVQQRARQNHLLLSRSTEMMQQFIHALVPTVPPTTYNPGGQLAATESVPHALYEAVG